jgi:MFS family permease
MNPDKLFRVAAVPREKGQLAEGLRYVRRRSDLMTVMVLVLFVSTFGITYFSSLPIVAGNVFHTAADGYGLLSTLVAVGTFTGALMSARRGTKGRPRVRLMLVSAFFLGVFELITAFMPTYLTFGLGLIPLGFATMTFLNTANALVQTSVSPEMRGRVMGLYVLVLIGGNPIGGPMVGWMADAYGGRSPFYIGGAVSAVAAVVCAVVLIRRGGISWPVKRGLGLRVLKRAKV